jgi:PIN domain nuclease of toxin-antitoxin system
VIVIDTHVWLWWVSSPAKLSRGAYDAIDGADQVGVCTISCWEVAMLAARGRIKLDRDVRVWIRQGLAHERATPVPLSPEIAVDAGLISDEFPGDPSDRIIYATSRATGSMLVTKDARLRGFDAHHTVW